MPTISAILQSMLRSSEVLFPPTCLICQSPSTQKLCHRCQLPTPNYKKDDVRCAICYERLFASDLCTFCFHHPQNFCSSRFLWEYSHNARDFCVVLKYKPSLKLIDQAASYLSEGIDLLFENTGWDYLVPIPASKAGLKKRGFNHVELIAQRLKSFSKLKADILPLALENYSNRKPQASLSNLARMSGIGHRYRVTVSVQNLLAGSKILLIDDVSTTGATINAALQTIQKYRPSGIDVLTICRSPTWYKYQAMLGLPAG